MHDGQTIAIPRHHHPQREDEGFGCPWCGAPLNLLDPDLTRQLTFGNGIPCCGYWPSDEEAGRWLRAARAIRERQ